MGVETDGFAAMLRELKERSGRSYGALATRLHVSTSTLHRYCNGAAVPTEYAPVERFARACGATDAELVELHRRWIVADAARRREPGPAAAQPETAAGTGTDEAVEAVETVQVVSSPAAAERDRPGRTRTRVLLSAATVAVLAAAAAAFALRGTATPTAAPPTNPTASAAVAAPPSPGPGTSAPTTPAPTATATAPPAEVPAPFHVSVLTDNWGSACGQWFLSPRAPGQVAPPPDSAAAIGSWAAAQQAVPGGHLRLQLTAQGAGATPVVLHAAYVHVVSTQPAPRWNAYTPGSGCGGQLTPAAFAVDLDAPAPRAVPVPAQEGNVKGATSDFPYRVSDTDPQVFQVDAATRAQDVSWYLDVVWSSGDRQGTLKVDDHGRPFRTAGVHGAPGYSYEGKYWSPAQPED
ncbi:helix-turn-helix domain-containing protein [Kitasatospora sp. NPDC054939]